MIQPYDFDNANTEGDKEAVVVPNVPTLVNKLSANETNGIRDKINEIITFVNPAVSPIQFLELRLKFKGEGNTADELQIGDIVHGFKAAGEIWDNAIYEGGDINDRGNYTPVLEHKPDPVLLTAIASGLNQNFDVPLGFVARSVLKSRGELFKGSEWSQLGTVVTILVNVNVGNSIYIKP